MTDLQPARLHVLRPGLFTTVQDLGRVGYQRFGMSRGGAMDPFALRCANRLVNNPDSAAALEVTVRGPELQFERGAVIALTGGDFNASLDGVPVPGWTVVGVKPGSTLAVGERRSGARGYLAVSGGLDVPLVLGSRSTCVRSRTGGLGGRALAKGDELFGGQPDRHACLLIGRSFPEAARPPYRSSPTLRVVLGPQADAFVPEAVEVLTHSRYSLSPRSDRMGYRLVGPPLVHATTADIVSDATPLGAVQVPANQQPILLMADRQTTGGYPKIAVVISADIPLAAQLLPGDTIGFSTIEVAEAQHILREQQRRLAVTLPPVSP